MTRLSVIAIAAAFVTGMATMPALADNGRSNGNGHNNTGHNNGHENATLNHLNCPPGLARKDPPCVPPGQARHGVTTHEWTGRYAIGDVVDQDDFYYLDRLGDLPPLLDGQQYAVIDGTVVKLNTENYQLLQTIRLLSAITN